MQVDTSAPPSVPKYDPRSVIAVALCLAALFIDAFGWLLGIVGIVLLRRAVLPARTKWLLAAVALGPKILFLGVRTLSAPRGLSFTFEPWTLATSSSVWSWSIVLAAFGAFVLSHARSRPPAPELSPQPRDPQRPFLLVPVGLGLIAVGAAILLGLLDGFHRIDDVGEGRWALKHAARGTVATFTRDELASIEGKRNYTRRGWSDSVVVTLTDGRSYSVSTGSPGVFEELRRFATTANLAPGKARTVKRGETWTNGATGLGLKDYLGTYEYIDAANRERTTLEFWLDGGHVAGKETDRTGDIEHVRVLKNIRIDDTGAIAFDVATHAEMREAGPSTRSFSLQWSPSGETGQLAKDGLTIGLKKFRRR